MTVLCDAGLEDRRPLVAFVRDAARAATSVLEPGIEIVPAVSLSGGAAVSRLGAPPSDLDLSVHLLVRLEPGWPRSVRGRDDRLIALLLRYQEALAQALELPGRTTLHVGCALRREGLRTVEQRSLVREEVRSPARTPELARAVGAALRDGVLSMDVVVLTDQGPLKLDLRIVTSVAQPGGPSKISHGYDSLWFGRVFFDRGSVAALAEVHARAAELEGVGAPPAVDADWVYTRMTREAWERGHFLDHLKKRLRLHAWRGEHPQVEALLCTLLTRLCTGWAVASWIRQAILLTTHGLCSRDLLALTLAHGTALLEEADVGGLSPSVAVAARYLADVVGLVPGRHRGDLWAKAEDLRVALVELGNREAHRVARELGGAGG